MRTWGMVIAAVVALSLLAGSAPSRAQTEVRTTVPEYAGTRANAPVPPSMHTANRNAITHDPMWGGCVPSSVRTAALYHGIPAEKVDAFWHEAQRRVGRGGTNPQLLAEMLRMTMPDEKYYSYIGADADRVLNAVSARGALACSTMSTGDQYGGRPIHHWVNVAHYESGKRACFVDNNDPGFFHWLDAPVFARRAVDQGVAWIFCFTRVAHAAVARALSYTVPVTAVIVGCGVLILGFGADWSSRLLAPEEVPC